MSKPRFIIKPGRNNTVRGRVRNNWARMGEPKWDTLDTLAMVEGAVWELQAEEHETPAKVTQYVHEQDHANLLDWVKGCHFEWLD